MATINGRHRVWHKTKGLINIVVIITAVITSDEIVCATTYDYDNLHRITRVVYENGTVITYTYDEVGNRTRRVSTLQADTSIDGIVNFEDFAILASRWLEQDCIRPDWCEGADINWNTKAGIEDLAILAQQWLASVL
jgi:YD repeat-containing protein